MTAGVWRLKCTLFRMLGTWQRRRGVDLAGNYKYSPHKRFVGLPGWPKREITTHITENIVISLFLRIGLYET